jgi:hypothetical protein
VAADPLKDAAALVESLSASKDWEGVASQIELVRKELDDCLAYIPFVLSKSGGTKPAVVIERK